MDLKVINDFFAGDRLAKHLNIHIKEAERDYAVCVMKVTDELLNAKDTVHGGALFSLADYTFAVAANAENIISGRSGATVSQSAEIKYIRPALGSEIRAVAKCTHREGVKSYYEIEMFDDGDQLVSLAKVKGHTLGDPS